MCGTCFRFLSVDRLHTDASLWLLHLIEVSISRRRVTPVPLRSLIDYRVATIFCLFILSASLLDGPHSSISKRSECRRSRLQVVMRMPSSARVKQLFNRISPRVSVPLPPLRLSIRVSEGVVAHADAAPIETFGLHASGAACVVIFALLWKLLSPY